MANNDSKGLKKKLGTKKKDNKKFSKDKILNKCNVISFGVILCDVIFVIVCAMKNKIHYVSMMGEDIIMGEYKDLFLGNNYINPIATCFFYLYFLAVWKIFLKNKITKRFAFIWFLVIVGINLLLFCIFTKRIY